jgi:type VI secretion system secreted protein Hcp
MKIVKNAVALSLVVGAAAVAADANAIGPGTTGGPITAYMKIRGAKTGDFKGDVTVKGRTAESLVLGIDYEVQTPFDLATGQASGKRQHSPLVLVKPIDAASPQIYEAAVTGEVLTNVEIDLVQTTVQGTVNTLFKYLLTNARISSVHHSMTTNCVAGAPCKAAAPDGNIVGPDEPTESVALTFQRIEIEHLQGKTSASDNWEDSAL